MKLFLSLGVLLFVTNLNASISCPAGTTEATVSYTAQQICTIRCENCDQDSTATLELSAANNLTCTSAIWHYSANLGNINTLKIQMGMALMVKTNSNLTLGITGCMDQAGTSIKIKNIEIR